MGNVAVLVTTPTSPLLHCASRRALTLIELLAVTVLLGLIAATLAGALRRPEADPAEREQRAAERWLATLRAQALTLGTLRVEVRPDCWLATPDGAPQPIAVWTPDARCRWRIDDADGHAISVVAIDHHGRMPDLRWTLASPGGPARTWHLHGLSGHWATVR